METQPPLKGRSSAWYFVALVLLATVLLGWLYLFIQEQLQPGQQLNLDQVRTASKLWQENGPKDYQLLYTVQRGGGSKDQFFVEVRGGKVQFVVLNGRDKLEDHLENHSIPGLLRDIEIFLKQD